MRSLLRTTIAGLVLGAGTVPGAIAAQAMETEWTRAAESFIRKQEAGDFKGAESMLAPETASALGEGKLEAIWKQLGAAGPLGAVAVEQVQEAGGYHVVDLAASFGPQKLRFRVAVDGDHRVGGYFVLPPAPPAYEAPAYVDTAKFTERELTVGTKEYPLKATLTLPKGAAAAPVVVLVHGSGPQDENETIGPNQPFHDLAWGLATKGVAVLRYEKRTHAYGAQMKGPITVDEETIVDALAALGRVRHEAGVDPARVFLLGHSLGGMLAPEIADRDGHLAGVIVMAGSPRKLEELVSEQLGYIGTLPDNQSPEAQKQLADVRALMARLERHEVPADSVAMGAPASYYYDLEKRDAIAFARKVTAPMLFLQGGRDYQVTEKDLALWKQALGSRKNVAFHLYPDLSHLFMAGTGKATPSEYMSERKHVAGKVLDDIAAFVEGAGR